MKLSDQPSDALTDAEVIDRVQRGDVPAFATLVERYERAVLAAVLPVVRDMHMAQDVVQDVFVNCFRRIGTLRDGSRFAPWVLRTAGREAVHSLKRTRRMRLVTDVDVSNIVHTSLDDQTVGEERERLLYCVRCLPTHERLVISMHYFDGHDVNAIARFTGRPIGTITKQLSRAVQRLREQLNKEQPSWKTRTIKTA